MYSSEYPKWTRMHGAGLNAHVGSLYLFWSKILLIYSKPKTKVYIILLYNVPKPVNHHAIKLSIVNLDPNIFESFHCLAFWIQIMIHFKHSCHWIPIWKICKVWNQNQHTINENMALIHMICLYSFSIDYTW